MLDKIHLYFCTIATIIVTIGSIVFKTPLPQAAYNLIVTIITFYCIGVIAKLYLMYVVFKQEEAPVTEDNALTPINDLEQGEQIMEDEKHETDGFIDSFKERLIEGLNEDSQVYSYVDAFED